MAQVASELISITNNEKLADSKYIKDLELGDKKQSDINKDSLAGGVYNVTKLHPRQNGYYTLSTAISEVPQALQGVGMVITYQTGENSWETKQFKGALSDFTDSTKWEDFGGGEAGDGVYDISADHNDDQYSTLQQAVAAIPSGVGKGGMEIKYIDSNTGEYRQFRLVTPYFGTPPQLVNLSQIQPVNLYNINGVWGASSDSRVHTKRLQLSSGKTYTIICPSTNENNVVRGYLTAEDTYTQGTSVIYATDGGWGSITKGNKEVINTDERTDIAYIYWRSDDAGVDTRRQDPVIYVQDNNAEYTFNEDDWVEYSSIGKTLSEKVDGIEEDVDAISESLSHDNIKMFTIYGTLNGSTPLTDSRNVGFELGKKYRIRCYTTSPTASGKIQVYLRTTDSATAVAKMLAEIGQGESETDWINYIPSENDGQYLAVKRVATNGDNVSGNFTSRIIVEIHEVLSSNSIGKDVNLCKGLLFKTKNDLSIDDYVSARIVSASGNVPAYYAVNNTDNTRIMVLLPVVPTYLKLDVKDGYKVSIHQWVLDSKKLIQNVNGNSDRLIDLGTWFPRSFAELVVGEDDKSINKDANAVYLCIAKNLETTITKQEAYDNVDFEVVGKESTLPTAYTYDGEILLGNRLIKNGFSARSIFKKKGSYINVQGADCYDGYLVLAADAKTGTDNSWHIYNIDDMSLVGTVAVPTIGNKHPHCNTLKFAKNLHAGNNDFPYIYVSEGAANHTDTQSINGQYEDCDRIIVYELIKNGSTFTLLQVKVYTTYQLDRSIVGVSNDFAIDEDNGYLYLIGNTKYGGYSDNWLWSKFELKQVSGNTTVNLTDNDIIESWGSKGYYARQGCMYRNGVIYALAGQFSWNGVDNVLVAMNVKTKKMQATISLAPLLIDENSPSAAEGYKEEPESIFVHNGKVYLLSYSCYNPSNVSTSNYFSVVYLYELVFEDIREGTTGNSSDGVVPASNLDGKTIVALGDSSLCNMQGTGYQERWQDSITWLRKIAVKHNMTYYNEGRPGNSMVSAEDNQMTGSAWPARIDPMYKRFDDDMPDNADYVLVIGGSNDHKHQDSLVNDSELNPDNTLNALEVFKKGLRILCKGLIEKYVNSGAKICFFTCWQSFEYDTNEGVTNATFKQEEFADAIEEVCNEYSIPCFNSRKRSGLYMFDEAFRTKYCQSYTDRNHLNSDGHDYFMPRAEAFLESL